MRDASFCAKLRANNDPETLYAIIAETQRLNQAA
jgi:hypothetical protein